MGEDLVKKARDHGLNLIRFFEDQLRGYFSYINGMMDNYTLCISRQSAKIKEYKFYERNDKSNNLNFNSYNPLWVCSVAGYHKGLRSL